MRLKFLFLLLIILTGIAGFLSAQEENDDSEFETPGFDSEFGSDFEFSEIKIDLKKLPLISEENQFPYSLNGFFKQEAAYSYSRRAGEDYPKFSKFKSILNLELSVKLPDDWQAKVVGKSFYDFAYQIEGRDKFSNETIDQSEQNSEFKDFYLEGPLSKNVRLKIGRQIIAWGEAETEQIIDLANPRDLTEPGLVDLEDARISVTATKLTILEQGWELALVAVHEISANKTAAKNSEFDPYKSIREAGILVSKEEIPSSEFENTEYLARLFKSFHGTDISFIWGDVYDDTAYLELEKLLISTNSELTLVPKHKRIKAYGFAANRAISSWILRIEWARKTGKALIRKDIQDQLATALKNNSAGTYFEKSGLISSWLEKNTLQGMLGAEYSGISDLTLALDLIGTRIENYDDRLKADETEGTIYFSLTHEAVNATLTTKLIAIHFINNSAEVYRLSFDYDIVDALTLSAGAINYHSSDSNSAIESYENNDRLFASVKYSF